MYRLLDALDSKKGVNGVEVATKNIVPFGQVRLIRKVERGPCATSFKGISSLLQPGETNQLCQLFSMGLAERKFKRKAKSEDVT